MISLVILIAPSARSQEVKVDVKGKVVEETDQRANQKTEEAIDYGFDKVEEGIGNLFKKKEKKDKTKAKDEVDGTGTGESPSSGTGTTASTGAQQSQATLKWNKYDFIPGEKIIFEDDQEGEVNGEFPSRWDLAGGGNVENASFGEQNVIYFKEASSCIVPSLPLRCSLMPLCVPRRVRPPLAASACSTVMPRSSRSTPGRCTSP